MPKLPPSPDSAERLKRMDVLSDELMSQSDRGVAILATAWLDNTIKTTLHSCLHFQKESWDKLFERGGPLDSLASRIDLLTLLGVISPGARQELHRLRDIRNEFAHLVAHKDQHVSLNFDSSHISEKVKSLNCVEQDPKDSARHKFIRACLWFVAEFDTIWIFGLNIGDVGYIHLPDEEARSAA